MTWTVAGLIEWSEAYLNDKGVKTPRLDAELLLARTLRQPRIGLYTRWDQPLNETELSAFKALLKRRAAREPLAYIVGEKEFYSLSFEVSPQVLIPRPETEAMVDLALDFLRSGTSTAPRVLDLATGSGCLLLAVLANATEGRGTGTDLSREALEVAARNARRHGLEDRVDWLTMDLREPWPADLAGTFDLITANLPYVSEADYAALEPELKDHEPRGALVPGPRGTEALGWVLPNLYGRLAAGGLALLEIGSEQGGEAIKQARRTCPDLTARVLPDLAGKDRILALTKDGG